MIEFERGLLLNIWARGAGKRDVVLMCSCFLVKRHIFVEAKMRPLFMGPQKETTFYAASKGDHFLWGLKIIPLFVGPQND